MWAVLEVLPIPTPLYRDVKGLCRFLHLVGYPLIERPVPPDFKIAVPIEVNHSRKVNSMARQVTRAHGLTCTGGNQFLLPVYRSDALRYTEGDVSDLSALVNHLDQIGMDTGKPLTRTNIKDHGSLVPYTNRYMVILPSMVGTTICVVPSASRSPIAIIPSTPADIWNLARREPVCVKM